MMDLRPAAQLVSRRALLFSLLLVVLATTPRLTSAQLTVSANAGVVLPVGQFTTNIPFGDMLDLGVQYSANLHIPVGVKQRWGIRLTGGYWSNPLQQESTNYRLTQIPALLGPEFNFMPQGKWQIILALQPGVFITGTNLEETTTRGYFGAMGSAQLRYKVYGYWNVYLQGQYARILSRGSVSGGVQDLNYVPVSIGVGYTFDRRDE